MKNVIITLLLAIATLLPVSGQITQAPSGVSIGPTGIQGDTGPAGPGYKATSTTSLLIGTGSKAFTTQAGLAYSVGARARASSAADGTNYMEGLVTAYSGTGLTINVTKIGGSGTKTDWNINLAGDIGADGSLTGSAGGDLSGTYPNPGVAKVNGGSVPASAAVVGTDSSSRPIAALGSSIVGTLQCTDAVGTDSYACNLSPAIAAYTTNACYSFKAGTANTGAASIAFNGLAALPIKKLHDQDLATGDIESGQIVTVCYDGTNAQMQSQTAASSGGGVALTGTVGQIPYVSTTNAALTGSANLFFSPTALSTPAAPVITNVGTPGSDTWGYVVVAFNSIGSTVGSTEGTTATGNATLDGTNYNNVATAAVTGSTSCDIYRVNYSFPPPYFDGKIGSVACGSTFSDQGQTGDYAGPPETDTSMGIKNAGVFRSGHVAIGDALPDYNENAIVGYYLVNGVASPTLSNAAFVQTESGAARFNYSPVLNGTSQAVFGISNTLNASGTSTDLTINGLQNVTNYSGSGNLLSFFGLYNTPTYSGSHALPTAAGKLQYLTAVGAGTITNSYNDYSTSLYASTAVSNSYGYWYNTACAGCTVGNNYGVYISRPSLGGGTFSTLNVAYFNENQTGIAGAGKDFAWYSEGGTNHLETGKADTVGVEIEAFASQSASLFRTVASDGATVLTQIRASGALSLVPCTAATLSTVLANNTDSCMCSDCQPTSGVDDTCTGSGGIWLAYKTASAVVCR